MLSLRSRTGDLAAQWWYSDCGDVMSPFPPSGNEGYIRNRDVPFQSVTESHVMTNEIGIPTKAPQELPLPEPCVGLLILPIWQTIGPGSTQRRSTTAVPRATQTIGFAKHCEACPSTWKRHTAELPPPRGG